MFLDTSHFRLLEKSLDASALRQKVIANNVANADTPHFKRSEVQFEQLLHKEMKKDGPYLEGYRTHPKHIPFRSSEGTAFPLAEPMVVTDHQSAMNNNQNNVDIDYEMSLMAQNQLRYNALVQQASGSIKKIRTAIGGRV
jgi:flagellar basal-body rod protein FlgB